MESVGLRSVDAAVVVAEEVDEERDDDVGRSRGRIVYNDAGEIGDDIVTGDENGGGIGFGDEDVETVVGDEVASKGGGNGIPANLGGFMRLNKTVPVTVICVSDFDGSQCFFIVLSRGILYIL